MTIPFNTQIFALDKPIVDPWAGLSTALFVEFDSPVTDIPLPSQKARLRSVGGLVTGLATGAAPEWSELKDLQNPDDGEPISFVTLSQALTETLIEEIQSGRPDKAFCALVNEMAQTEDSWEDFRSEVKNGRFEANVWFERDRKNVRLTDGLTSRDIVCLWDDDVDQAIEDGYLTPPSIPRASDIDWLDPLLEYAQQTGALEGLSLDENPRPKTPYAPMRG